jgi:hypothetical protein
VKGRDFLGDLGMDGKIILKCMLKMSMSHGSSGSLVSDSGLDDRGSIPNRGRGFFF